MLFLIYKDFCWKDNDNDRWLFQFATSDIVCDSLLANSIVCYFFWPIKFRPSQSTDQSDVSFFYSKGELKRQFKATNKTLSSTVAWSWTLQETWFV